MNLSLFFFFSRLGSAEEKPNGQRFKVHFVCCYRRESLFINQHCVIDFLVELMLNSSKFFRNHDQIPDSFVVQFSSHRLKISVELRTHYAGIVKKISFEYRKILFSIKFSKMTSLFIILFMFIHNSSSKNGRKTITKYEKTCQLENGSLFMKITCIILQ